MSKRLVVGMLIIGMMMSMQVYAEGGRMASSFDVSIGAGYGTLGYGGGVYAQSPLSATTSGSWSGKAHVGYTWFFCPYVGIGVGASISRYGESLTLNGQQVWKDVTATNGELYHHRLDMNQWRESQPMWAAEFPVVLAFSAPAGKIKIIGEIGAKYGLPFVMKYTGQGELTHTGQFYTGAVLHDLPQHGFYTESNYRPTGSLKAPDGYWALTGKLGVAIPLMERLDLTVQAYTTVALTGSNVGAAKMMEAMGDMAMGDMAIGEMVMGEMAIGGFRSDREGMAQAHYFMSEYSSLLHSPMATGQIKPWCVGLEIGIRYSIPHGKAKGGKRCVCRILED